MITERMSPRRTVYLWLDGLRRVSASAKPVSDLIEDRVVELSEPILAMTASSPAADPEKMLALLRSDRYASSAQRYLMNNWILNLGLPDSADPASRQAHLAACAAGAQEALARLAGESIPGKATAAGISDMMDRIAAELRSPDNPGHERHGEGTGILLREVIGLPGDADVCLMVTDPAVLRNAVAALRQLGVALGDDLTASAGDDLASARRRASEETYEAADFGDFAVEADSGWEVEGDRHRRTVFLDAGGPESKAMVFAVEFLSGSDRLAGAPEFTLPARSIEDVDPAP